MEENINILKSEYESISVYSYENLIIFADYKLREFGIKESEIEARNIVFEVFDINLLEYTLNRKKNLDAQVNNEKLDRYFLYLDLRLKRIPFQYIINKQNFCGLNFYVDENVLIPRLDTEVLVEKVMSDNTEKNLSILDLCTGSGAIAVSLKKLGNYKDMYASDISDKALNIAKKNALSNKVDIQFISSDMFENIDKKFDIIVSNPPYIETEEIKSLDIEVKDREPYLALDGKEDGLYFYKIIASHAKKYLKEYGIIYLEIGHNQGEAIKYLFKDYKKVDIFKDLANLDRVAKIYI